MKKILDLYRAQMKIYGESYASAFYLAASAVLSICGVKINHIFDSFAGMIWFVADVTILSMQVMGRGQKLRPLILFGSSALGFIFFLMGSIFNEIMSVKDSTEFMIALCRFLANGALLVVSILAFLDLSGKLISGSRINDILKNYPGRFYLICNFLFFIFAVGKYILNPILPLLGYVLAAILWLLASNAIRMKFDKDYGHV